MIKNIQFILLGVSCQNLFVQFPSLIQTSNLYMTVPSNDTLKVILGQTVFNITQILSGNGKYLKIGIPNLSAGYHNITYRTTKSDQELLFPSMIYDLNYTFSYHPKIKSISSVPLSQNQNYYLIQIIGQGFTSDSQVYILNFTANITYQDPNYLEAIIQFSQTDMKNQSYYTGGQGLSMLKSKFSSFQRTSNFGTIYGNITYPKDARFSSGSGDYLIYPRFTEASEEFFTYNYQGILMVPKTAKYTVYLQADDEVRVYIRNNTSIFSFGANVGQDNIDPPYNMKGVQSKTINLKAQYPYLIDILFIQNKRVGVFFLSIGLEGKIYHPAPNEIFFSRHLKPQVRVKGNGVWFSCSQCDFDGLQNGTENRIKNQTKRFIDKIYQQICGNTNQSLNYSIQNHDQCIHQRSCLDCINLYNESNGNNSTLMTENQPQTIYNANLNSSVDQNLSNVSINNNSNVSINNNSNFPIKNNINQTERNNQSFQNNNNDSSQLVTKNETIWKTFGQESDNVSIIVNITTPSQSQQILNDPKQITSDNQQNWSSINSSNISYQQTNDIQSSQVYSNSSPAISTSDQSSEPYIIKHSEDCQSTIQQYMKGIIGCEDCRKQQQCQICVDYLKFRCQKLSFYPRQRRRSKNHQNQKVDQMILEFGKNLQGSKPSRYLSYQYSQIKELFTESRIYKSSNQFISIYITGYFLSSKPPSSSLSFLQRLLFKFNTPVYPGQRQGSIRNMTISIFVLWNVTDYYLKNEQFQKSYIYYSSLGLSMSNPLITLSTLYLQIAFIIVLYLFFRMIGKRHMKRFCVAIAQTQFEAWLLYQTSQLYFSFQRLQLLNNPLQVIQTIGLIVLIVLQYYFIFNDLTLFFKQSSPKEYKTYFTRGLQLGRKDQKLFRVISLVKKLFLTLIVQTKITSQNKLRILASVQLIFTIFFLVSIPFRQPI